MSIDDFDDEFEEDEELVSAGNPPEDPPDLEAIAVHPLVPQGIPPALWGECCALVQLNTSNYMAEMDDRALSHLNHEDAALFIRPSIRACRENIIRGLRALGVTEDFDVAIKTLSEYAQSIRYELRLIAELRKDTRPSVSYSRALELPLDPEPQRQCVIVLEEMLVLHRTVLRLTDLSVLAENPKGPVLKAHRETLSQRYSVSQITPKVAYYTRYDKMTDILRENLDISYPDAHLTVKEVLEDAYPARFPLDQPSPARTRELLGVLIKDQRELQRESRHLDKIIAEYSR